jgi:hypothetical protein
MRPHLNGKKLGMVSFHRSDAGRVKYEDSNPGQSGQKVRPYSKITREKMAGSMAQTLKHLP